MSSNVAVFEADIDTSKLEVGSARAKKAFDDIGNSGTRSFDSLQGQVEVLQNKVDSLEGKLANFSQKSKTSISSLAGTFTGLSTNIASTYFTLDNLDKVQLRVTKTQRLYEEQLAKVKQMQSDGKTGTEQYAFELRQLDEMQQRAKQSQSDLTQSQFMFGLNTITLATSTIPNAIKAIQGMDFNFKVLRTTLWTIATHPVFLAMTGFLLSWEFGISKIIEKTQGLKDGEASLVNQVQKLWDGQNKVTTDGVEGFTSFSGSVKQTGMDVSSLTTNLEGVSSGVGTLTGKVKSYADALKLAKSEVEGIDRSELWGNYNDTLKKLAQDELSVNNSENFDRFMDIKDFDFMGKYQEKWESILHTIKSTDTATKEQQRNLHESIRQSLLPDMKEYATVIKNAHDPKRIQDFRKEIQQLVKDFKLSTDEAKELSDTISDLQKKSSDGLRRTDVADVKKLASDLGFNSVTQFWNVLEKNKGGDWAGLFSRRVKNLKRSGLLGGITTEALENYADALRVEGLINQDVRANMDWLNLTSKGIQRTIAEAGHRDFLEGQLAQAQFNGAKRDAVSSGHRVGVSSTSFGKKGRRSHNPTTPMSKIFPALQRQFGFSNDAEIEEAIRVSMRGYGTRSGYFDYEGAQQSATDTVRAILARRAEEQFQSTYGVSSATAKGYASELGVSFDFITSTLRNELTQNDIQSQIDFQRRLASMSA